MASRTGCTVRLRQVGVIEQALAKVGKRRIDRFQVTAPTAACQDGGSQRDQPHLHHPKDAMHGHRPPGYSVPGEGRIRG